MSRSAVIDVGVNQRILWIGGEAYPLQNIARAQTVRLVPSHGRAVAGWFAQVLVWLVLGVGGALGVSYANMPKADADAATRYIAIGAIALILFSTIRLLVMLARRTYYALVIETAGSPRTAVVSPDWRMLDGLVHQIMAAINNPAASFHHKVVNYYGGNHVKQFGNNNTGMVNH